LQTTVLRDYSVPIKFTYLGARRDNEIAEMTAAYRGTNATKVTTLQMIDKMKEYEPQMWRALSQNVSSNEAFKKLPEHVKIFRFGHPDISQSISWTVNLKLLSLKNICRWGKWKEGNVISVAWINKEDIYHLGDSPDMCEVIALPQAVNLIGQMNAE